MTISVGRAITGGVVTVVDAATTAWVAAVVAAGGTVSPARQSLVDSLIVGLKADGLWTTLDRLWLFAAENTQSALIDVVALDQASAVSAPTFTPTGSGNAGYAGNGTSSYINTTFNPSTQGVNYTLNSAEVSVWSLTSRAADGAQAAYGASDGTNIIYLFLRFLSTIALLRTNEDLSTNAQATVSDSLGHYNVVKSGSGVSDEVAYLNGTALSMNAAAGSTVIPSDALFVCARSVSGTPTNFSTDQIAMFSAGGTQTALQASSFYSRLRTYMTAVGVP